MGQSTKPTQPSIPQGPVYIYIWITGVKIIKCRLRLHIAVWLQVKVGERGLGLWSRLYAGSVTTMHLQLQYAACVFM